MDVVIPAFNARERIGECVDSLLGDSAVRTVIVVDDCSQDGTAEALAGSRPRTTVIRLPAHLGLAYANNRGLDLVGAPWVLFLNDDVVARPGAVSELVAALAAAPAAVSAGGRLVDPGGGSTQPAYQPRQLPGAAALLVRIIGVERAWPRNPVTGAHLRRPLPDGEPVATDRQPAGACLLVRHAAALATGGWDERYPLWYEDVDFSRRLARRGPALYVPQAVFEHRGGASTGGWSKPRQHARLYRSTLLYAWLHLGLAGRVVVAPAMLAVCLIRAAGELAHGRAAAACVYRLLAADALRVARGHEPSARQLSRPSGARR